MGGGTRTSIVVVLLGVVILSLHNGMINAQTCDPVSDLCTSDLDKKFGKVKKLDQDNTRALNKKIVQTQNSLRRSFSEQIAGVNKRVDDLGEQIENVNEVLTALKQSLDSLAKPQGVRLPEKPNIVLMFADDLGWNDVGWHNDQVRTPVMDGLLRDGVEFDQLYTQPACTPSRSALMSGRYPANTGMSHNIVGAHQVKCHPLEDKLMSNRLKELGYATHILGKWHLGYCDWRCTPLERGFDTFYGFYNGFVDHYSYQYGVEGLLPFGHDFRNGTEVDYSVIGKQSNDVLLAGAKQAIQRRDEKPFLLYLNWAAPHFPTINMTLPEWEALYPDVEDPGRKGKLSLISHMDWAIGEVVKTLKEEGVMDNTIIIFMGDNGAEPPLGDNSPLRGAKKSLFEGAIRAPAFVHSPLLKKTGHKAKGLFHLVDWYPTFVKLAGGDLDSDLDGVDQSDFIINGGKSNRNEFLVNIDVHPVPSMGYRAIRSGAYKLIHGYSGQDDGYGTDVFRGYKGCRWDMPGNTQSSVPDKVKHLKYAKSAEEKQLEKECIAASVNDTRLYNVLDDPGERINLASKRPDLVQELLAKLDAYEAYMTPPPAWHNQFSPAAFPENNGGVWTPGWCTAGEMFEE